LVYIFVFCRWQYGPTVPSFKFVQWAPKDTSFLYTRVHIGRSGSFKVSVRAFSALLYTLKSG